MIEDEDWSRVAVDQGVVTKATRTVRSGTHPLPDQAGQFTFFIESVDVDGNCVGWWCGQDYGEATRQAEELTADSFGPIYDLVVEGHA